jgi:sugar/nucleoside kinase (ribokinase family)
LIQNYVSLLFANASEARALTGLTAAEACQKLSTWCGYVVVTDGANGSYISNNGSIIHYPTKAITKIIDTTGAGDLYTCGFLDGWLKKMPLEQCAAQGTLLATTVIQQAGASLPASTWQSLKISIV